VCRLHYFEKRNKENTKTTRSRQCGGRKRLTTCNIKERRGKAFFLNLTQRRRRRKGLVERCIVPAEREKKKGTKTWPHKQPGKLSKNKSARGVNLHGKKRSSPSLSFLFKEPFKFWKGERREGGGEWVKTKLLEEFLQGTRFVFAVR